MSSLFFETIFFCIRILIKKEVNKLVLSPKAENMIGAAQRVAIHKRHFSVQPLHLLYAIVQSKDVFVVALFQHLKVNALQLQEVLDNFMSRFPSNDGSNLGDPNLSKDFYFFLNRVQATIEAEQESEAKIAHLLIGLSNTPGESDIVMRTFDITSDSIMKFYTSNKDGYKEEEVETINSPSQEKYLSKYAVNLVELARKKELDPVVGRGNEMRQIIQILSRRTKNNPVIVGEPGIGKTAITEGLADRIAKGDVPKNLQDCNLYSLNLTAIMAGSEYRGEFENRMQNILKEVKDSQGKDILVIDEIHVLMTSNNGDGQTSAADILKPSLARGEVSIIGTTTLDEYQKYFEKDTTLERRFQRIVVDEPSVEMCLTILRGLKERYENYHEVQIKDEALVTAVRMSKRYMPSRRLPDSAIDLIDEACSKIRMEINSKPSLIDEVERDLMNVEVALLNINPKELGVQEMIYNLEQRRSQLQEHLEELNIKWSSERKVIDEIQVLKQLHEKLIQDKEIAERDGSVNLTASLNVKINENEKSIELLKSQLLELQSTGRLIREVVTSNEIAEVVSDKTGIPTARMGQSEQTRLLEIEKEIGESVIGQDEAITEIAEALRINRTPGMGDANRPIGSFMFLGTTGVGKTYLAKKLAEYLFDDDSAMIRLDMSEFSEKHAVSRLIGAPPGYVGYESGGELTEPVRNKPFCILLLDEIEKAHPDIFNILLQILEDGRVTDSQGRLVNFKNAIIIMTSNIGSEIIQEAFDESHDDATPQEVIQSAQEDVDAEVKDKIKPEILNRLDEIIMFNPLDKEAVERIALLELKKLGKNMKSEGGYELKWTKDALNFIVNTGYDPAFGARPVKRAINSLVRGPLSVSILQGEINAQSIVEIDLGDDELLFRDLKDFKNISIQTYENKSLEI